MKRFIFAFIGIAVALALVGGGFYFGYARGTKVPQEVVIKNVTDTVKENTLTDFAVFWEAWEKLKRFHVDAAKVTDQDLLYGAIEGLAGSFGDPNTNFFPPSDAQKFEEDVSGYFGGIGAEIGLTDKILTITSPLKNTPADRAGLKPGDMILKINNESTEGLDVIDAVKKIRGPVGTQVTLTILREEWQQTRDIVITREIITVPTLDLSLKDDNKIGDIQLYSFNENASLLFYKAVYGLLLGNTQGLILDLRNNPGGYLEVATNLTGWFVERGQIIVSERFRDGDDRVFRSDGNAALLNMPVVVLINRGSASASEIVAGALRDLRGVKLVGERSFGKGTVQEVNSLQDGSSLKITVAHWVTPKGEIIAKNGIAPDYEVKMTDEDIKNKRDPQLEKALEVLRLEIAARKSSSTTLGSSPFKVEGQTIYIR